MKFRPLFVVLTNWQNPTFTNLWCLQFHTDECSLSWRYFALIVNHLFKLYKIYVNVISMFNAKATDSGDICHCQNDQISTFLAMPVCRFVSTLKRGQFMRLFIFDIKQEWFQIFMVFLIFLPIVCMVTVDDIKMIVVYQDVDPYM